MLSIADGHSLFATGLLHLIDYLAFFYLVTLLWIPSYWLVFHAAIRFWRRLGNRAFGVAALVWVIFAAGLIVSRHILFARRLDRSTLTWVVGAALFMAASWLDVQTRHAFGWRRLVGLTELDPHHHLCGVVRTGIYGRLRHPRYALYMLMLFSVAFLTGADAIFLLAFLSILMYQVVAQLEERELLDQYGPQYDDYRRSVPRFVPHLRPTPKTRISSGTGG